jgi:transcriptional regulator with XRE-family HTH domain
MPVSPLLKVEALAKDFRSQRRLAEVLDVSPAQVSRWLRGQGMDPRNAERVDLLELAMSQLLRLYDMDTAIDWLHGFNPHLHGRRPIDVIRQAKVLDLLDALDQEAAGSYV